MNARHEQPRPAERPDWYGIIGGWIVGAIIWLIIGSTLAGAAYQTGVVILGILGLLPT